jgi:GT2 family glycosyltransferase
VIVTRNRRDELLTTVARLRETDAGAPIVVVDNGSTDGSPAAVRTRHGDVTVVELGRNLGGAGRTVGVRLASTPYVAFSDDDSWWAPGALARAVETFEAFPRLAVLAGRVLVGPDNRLDPTCVAMGDSPLPPEPDLPGPSVLGFVACGAVVRREAYLAVGGFHELLGVGGEEQLLAVDLARAGWGLAYVDAVVAHHHPSPVRDLPARRRQEAVNRLLVSWLRRRPGVVVARTVAALFRDRESRRAVADVLAVLPAVLRDRRVIDDGLERRLRLIEHG